MNSTKTQAVAVHRPLAPLDVQQTKESMQVYQNGLQALLDPSDWQTFFDKKTGEERGFLKRSGWRKIALWFELSLETRSIEIERDKNDNPVRARVIARALAPNGRYADGEGGCAISERPMGKPENDLPATAATRALNRAVSNLVGLGAVSAEELDGTGDDAAAMPFGPVASPALLEQATQAIGELLPDIDANAFIELLSRTFSDGLPEVAARTLKGLAWFAAPTNPEEGKK